MKPQTVASIVKRAITDVRALDELTPAVRLQINVAGVITYDLLKNRYRVTFRGKRAIFDSCFDCGGLIVIMDKDQPSECTCGAI